MFVINPRPPLVAFDAAAVHVEGATDTEIVAVRAYRLSPGGTIVATHGVMRSLLVANQRPTTLTARVVLERPTALGPVQEQLVVADIPAGGILDLPVSGTALPYRSKVLARCVSGGPCLVSVAMSIERDELP